MSLLELSHPGADFLAESERGRVLEVRAADLHDVGESALFLGECFAEVAQFGEQPFGDVLGDGDVHCRGKCIVGRLTMVDMVVGVDGALAAHRATGHFDSSIRNHLVGIHVRLSAATGLPNVERKVFVEFAGDDFVGRSNDEIRLFLRSVRRVPDWRELPLFSEVPNARINVFWKVIRANLEVMQGALRLRSPVALCIDFHFSHAVGLFTCRHYLNLSTESELILAASVHIDACISRKNKARRNVTL